jgi:hypothetical protein
MSRSATPYSIEIRYAGEKRSWYTAKTWSVPRPDKVDDAQKEAEQYAVADNQPLRQIELVMHHGAVSSWKEMPVAPRLKSKAVMTCSKSVADVVALRHLLSH